jgi:hypothetical protein
MLANPVVIARRLEELNWRFVRVHYPQERGYASGFVRWAPFPGDSKPSDDELALVDSSAIQALAGGVLNSGAGFEAGRSRHGLEELITEYLRASDAERSSDRSDPRRPELKALQIARSALLQALIHFAARPGIAGCRQLDPGCRE